MAEGGGDSFRWDEKDKLMEEARCGPRLERWEQVQRVPRKEKGKCRAPRPEALREKS